jgi:hypothetical protein
VRGKPQSFDYSVFRQFRQPELASQSAELPTLESEPARAAGAAPKADERASVTVRVRRSPHMEGAPPARQRALKARAGSHLGDRHFHLPLATTQPVDGAVLIRR